MDVRSVPLATDPHSNLAACTVVGSTGLLAHVERTVQTACTTKPTVSGSECLGGFIEHNTALTLWLAA